ncbi:hypothetical protein SDC9_205071 [bioreactor metagenome]|uniref:Uncharacterized protein n=1 Tax=bioreactor metagenome TaxID=1076179 RepID=A0A645J1U9_9ZZZZ
MIPIEWNTYNIVYNKDYSEETQGLKNDIIGPPLHHVVEPAETT